MGRRRVDLLRLPRGRPVAQAVVRGAQVRAALDHVAREAAGLRRRRRAARGRRVARVGEEVAGPLPHVAGHVVEAEAVGRERAHRRRAEVAVGRRVLPRELALPGVRHPAPAGRLLVAPGEALAVQPAARRALPLGLGRQRLARPGRVGRGVLVGDLRDRMAAARVGVRPGPSGRCQHAPGT